VSSSTWSDTYCSDEQRFVCEADPYNECIQCPAGEVSSAGSVGCTAAGEIITIVGTDNNSSNIDTGLAVTSSTDTPRGIAIDASGNIYFAEQNDHRIRKITVSTGIISTAVGTGTAGYSGDNNAASSAQLDSPTGIVLDTKGKYHSLALLNFSFLLT
jgi:DNA-binding beta-propeller fold protein YncE